MGGARLVPELLVSDHAISRDFYVRILGFEVRYERPTEKFSYLDLGGAELMIEQETDYWAIAPRKKPDSRGNNLQIEVSAIDPILVRLKEAGIALFRPVEEAWYRSGDTYSGNRQFLVQDPVGYLPRIFEDLGRRLTPSSGRIVG